VGFTQPNSAIIYDTIPRPVAWIGNDGTIGVNGEINGFNNSGGMVIGGGSNSWRWRSDNDSSGPGLYLESSDAGSASGGGAPVIRIYAGAPKQMFDLNKSGSATFWYGVASKATTTGLVIAGTGITNTSTNNMCAYLSCSSVTSIVNDNTGTPVLTNTTATFVHQMFMLQPGGSITAASGLSGNLVPF